MWRNAAMASLTTAEACQEAVENAIAQVGGTVTKPSVQIGEA